VNKSSDNPIRKQCKALLIDNFIDTLSKTKLTKKEIMANIAFKCSKNR
jgi:hypothetical protein